MLERGEADAASSADEEGRGVWEVGFYGCVGGADRGEGDHVCFWGDGGGGGLGIGVGDIGVGEIGFGEMGFGEMGVRDSCRGGVYVWGMMG